MTKLDQDIFFSVLRSAIWEKPLDVKIPVGYDWSLLIQQFINHSLLGVVAHTLCSLPDEVRITPPLQEEVLNNVAQLVRARSDQQSLSAELCCLIKKEGLHPILLKGDSYGRLYPQSCVRSSGDIDLFFLPDEYGKAAIFVNSLSEIKHTPREIKHAIHEVGFSYKGQHIDLQRHLCMINRTRQFAKFDRWAKKRLTLDLCQPAPELHECVLVPDFYYNVVYGLFHYWKHIIYTGCCLKQLVDFAIIIKSLDSNQLSYVKTHICDDLRHLELSEAWNICGTFLVRDFNIDETKVPMLALIDDDRYKVCKDIILSSSFNNNAPLSVVKTLSSQLYWGIRLYNLKRMPIEFAKKMRQSLIKN